MNCFLTLQGVQNYKNQYDEARENLEQLEGFQNQELAKIKHMLLSAETSLEFEKNEKKNLKEQMEELELNIRDKDKKLEEFEATVIKLEDRIKSQDLTGDDRLEAIVSEVITSVFKCFQIICQ